MIKTFTSKTLRQIWATGTAKGARPDMIERIRQRLTALDGAKAIGDLQIHGFRLHRHKGRHADTWSIDVNGPWRITFTWDGKDAYDVDLRQDH